MVQLKNINILYNGGYKGSSHDDEEDEAEDDDDDQKILICQFFHSFISFLSWYSNSVLYPSLVLLSDKFAYIIHLP